MIAAVERCGCYASSCTCCLVMFGTSLRLPGWFSRMLPPAALPNEPEGGKASSSFLFGSGPSVSLDFLGLARSTPVVSGAGTPGVTWKHRSRKACPPGSFMFSRSPYSHR